MRSLLLLALSATGALATGCCPRVGDDNMCGCGPCGAGNAGANGDTGAKNGGNFANSHAPSAPVHATHTWQRWSPSDVAVSLKHLAQATPNAVSIISGQPKGGKCEEPIPFPSDCTSLPDTGTTGPTSTGGGSPGSSGSPSTGGSGSSTGPMTSGPSSAQSTGPASSQGSSSGGASSSGGSSSSQGGSSSSQGGSSSSQGSSSSPAGSSSTSAGSSSTSSASSSTKTSPSSTGGSCSQPTARVEWRNMNSADQHALMQATQCLMTTASRSGLAGAQSRWDDLVAVHQQMAPSVHQVGSFLVWHRQFMWIYEQELRNTCGYKGALPWWDETRDAGRYSKAPMMTGNMYGSAPTGQDQCIRDGSFAGITLHIGPGSGNTNHCLSRAVNERDSASVTQNFVNSCNSYTDYAQMCDCSYYGPHAYTHDAIGGSMSDVASSPNDPLFFLHHAFIDRNYRNWQLVNPSQRTYAIGGYTTQGCEGVGGSGCKKVTLNDRLSALNFYPDVSIAQVADTQGGHLCYYYDY